MVSRKQIAFGVAAAVLGAVAAIVLLWPSQSSEPRIPGLNRPQSLVLYSVDSTEFSDTKYKEAIANGKEVFQNYAVLGKVEIKDAAERAKLVKALQQGAVSPDGPATSCFWPRHAVVATEGNRRLEIVICFQCRQYTLDGKTFPLMSRKPESLLNRHLESAGIPIAP